MLTKQPRTFSKSLASGGFGLTFISKSAKLLFKWAINQGGAANRYLSVSSPGYLLCKMVCFFQRLFVWAPRGVRWPNV